MAQGPPTLATVLHPIEESCIFLGLQGHYWE